MSLFDESAQTTVTPDSRRGQTAVALVYGIVCHTSFALGVGSMILMMYFGMSRSFGNLASPWSWIVNGALILQFPIGHSLLLTGRGRALLARLAPTGMGTTLATTTYATIAALQIFALFAFWSATGTIWWQADGIALVVMTAVYAGSWLLLLKSMSDAGLALQTGSLGWVALLRNKVAVYPKMPQAGLFKFCRQPIYVAFTLTLWTVPTWTPDQLALAVALTAYCVVAPLFKEARYRHIYGAAFVAYARTVPYWVPRLRRKRARSRSAANSVRQSVGAVVRPDGASHPHGYVTSVNATQNADK